MVLPILNSGVQSEVSFEVPIFGEIRGSQQGRHAERNSADTRATAFVCKTVASVEMPVIGGTVTVIRCYSNSGSKHYLKYTAPKSGSG